MNGRTRREPSRASYVSVTLIDQPEFHIWKPLLTWGAGKVR